MKKVIVGCVGAQDLEVIQRLAANHDVIAVIFDLGEGAGLRKLHDQARAVGAARCHVLDVRDEFARACILPPVDDAAVDDRAREFIAGKLAGIAALEGPGEVIAPVNIASRVAPSRPLPVDCSATVAIAFEDCVPVAVNGIPMTLSEVVDCLTTLGDVHGIPHVRPAVQILRAAHRQLDQRSSGVAHLELFGGNIRASRSAMATT